MFFKGKYKNILLIFLIFLGLVCFIKIFQEYKHCAFLKDLNIDYLIGQHLMVAPEGTELTPAFKELITKYHIGNIKIYGYNYKNKEQLYNLIIDCQNLSLTYNKGIPLFVATDQEGGWVAHLKKGFTLPPSSYAIGKKGNRHYSYLAGRIIATELSTIGINMNFAPVADLYLNEKNWVIGPRSYGASIKENVAMMAEFIRAHTEQDVLPIIKHYPGLGRIKNDPHVVLITNKADFKTLVNVDLKPFTELMKTCENGIMIGNVAVPSIVKHMEVIDKSNYKNYYFLPASISEIIIKRFLIEESKYKGLIVSDEMNVLPIRNLMPMERIIYRSLKSGIDIVLINEKPGEIIKIINFLKKKYKKDKLFRQQIISSVKKIFRYKAFIFRKFNNIHYFSKRCFNISKFKKDADLNKINNKIFEKLNQDISLNTVDINRDKNNWLPLSEKGKILNKNYIIISSKKVLYNELKKFICFRNLKFIKIKSYITAKLKRNDINRVINNVDTDSMIIFSIMSKAHTRLVKEVYKKNKNIIIINLLHPYNIKELGMIDTILSTYSDNDAQIRSVVQILIKGNLNASNGVNCQFWDF